MRRSQCSPQEEEPNRSPTAGGLGGAEPPGQHRGQRPPPRRRLRLLRRALRLHRAPRRRKSPLRKNGGAHAHARQGTAVSPSILFSHPFFQCEIVSRCLVFEWWKWDGLKHSSWTNVWAECNFFGIKHSAPLRPALVFHLWRLHLQSGLWKLPIYLFLGTVWQMERYYTASPLEIVLISLAASCDSALAIS